MHAPHPKIRLTADLSPQVAVALKDLARRQQISLAQALSLAIGTESFLIKKQCNGAKLLIEQDGLFSELRFTR
jgi:hypothetical protein